MEKILTLKPGDPDVIYYSSRTKCVNGRMFHLDGGLFVYDFYHDDDDLYGAETITEEKAFEIYSKYYDPKNFYDLYA